MAALRVPTTRALSVVASGDLVQRFWYDDDGHEMPKSELGAVGCRTATSFLRLGQFELFHHNGESDLLVELAEHALGREFGHLRVQHPSESKAQLMVRMFDEICERHAHLIAEWLRVGYCQGNMNSDNSAIAGTTLDYGPFAFMEKFIPLYNPWVGGGVAYAFGRQPQAAAINLSGVAPAFVELVEHFAKAEGLSKAATNEAIEGVRRAVSHTYIDSFHAKLNEGCRQKLGLESWDDEAQELWDDLFRLMSSQCGKEGIDFTLLFRGLTELPPPPRRGRRRQRQWDWRRPARRGARRPERVALGAHRGVGVLGREVLCTRGERRAPRGGAGGGDGPRQPQIHPSQLDGGGGARGGVARRLFHRARAARPAAQAL